MKSILKSHIAAMSAYSPPLEGRDPDQHLLLDFNERTLPISKAVEDALVSYIRSGRIQMYPAYGDITDKIAAYCEVPADQLMITNGSDQGIDLIIRAATDAGDEAVIPRPSFAIYAQCAKVQDLIIREPAFTREGGFPLAECLDAISERTRLICIANPNNPSGTAVSREAIISILEAAPKAAVLVDECYFEYMRETVCDLVLKYPNLFVTRTFSKTWGIPSLRLGYVISAPCNIQALLNVRGPYDVNQLAVVAVQAALENPQFMRSYVTEVMNESKALLEDFLDQQKIVYWPSAANFLWVFPRNPADWRDALFGAGILVRPKDDLKGKCGLRITLGNRQQTERLLEVIQSVV